MVFDEVRCYDPELQWSKRFARLCVRVEVRLYHSSSPFLVHSMKFCKGGHAGAKAHCK